MSKREEEREGKKRDGERRRERKEREGTCLIDLSLRVLQGSLQCVSPGVNVSNSLVQLRVGGVLCPTCLVLYVCVCVRGQGVFEFAASKTETRGYAALCNLPPPPPPHTHTHIHTQPQLPHTLPVSFLSLWLCCRTSWATALCLSELDAMTKLAVCQSAGANLVGDLW